MDETRSLLLVDDEEGIRRVLALTLADMGWKVRAAASGEEALALFRQEPAAIVVTDVKMPGMDGLALLQAVKALDPECEVVLITGHGDMDLAIQGIKLDAADFIAKPLRDDALSIALSRAWERRAMRRALRLHAENLERLVEEKTRELLASERLAAVGQTVAGLSHAVKNMASGLEGSLFMLRQGLEADRKAWRDQGWEMLEANVRTLKGLSLDMLRIAKPEALRPAPTDPALPARQVAELLAPRFHKPAWTWSCARAGNGSGHARCRGPAPLPAEPGGQRPGRLSGAGYGLRGPMAVLAAGSAAGWAAGWNSPSNASQTARCATMCRTMAAALRMKTGNACSRRFSAPRATEAAASALWPAKKPWKPMAEHSWSSPWPGRAAVFV
jgi:FixJ family two-component response regulator